MLSSIRTRALLPAAVAVFILLSSCHSLPKHAALIPKDALFVLGIHTGELRKELAWSAITGSSLLDDLRKSSKGSKASDMLKDLESAGIDFGSTIYIYTKPDNRYESKVRIGGVVPVDNAGKVAAWVQKHFPGKTVRNGPKGIHEVMPDSSTVIAWNDDVLIAMNSITRAVYHDAQMRLDTISGLPLTDPNGIDSGYYQRDAYTEYIPDEAATYAEIEAAFSLPKGSDITSNERFKKIESGGHDISMYLAYDGLMDLTGGGAAGMGILGLSLGNTLYRNAAMAAGFDFKKGAIEGEALYYPADSMKDIARDFSKDNIDPDMLRRLPGRGLNMAAGYHISPTALKRMLERLGLIGYANMALSAQGLTPDDVLGAFSGDIVVALNNFRTETKMQAMDSATQEAYGLTPYPVTDTKMDYLLAFKIGDKAKMGKLISLVTRSEMMVQTAPETYAFPNTTDGPFMVNGDKFIAIGNVASGAQAFLKGAGGAMRDEVRDAIKGHPVGIWADVRGFINGSGEMVQQSPSDSAMYRVVRGVFGAFTMQGGEWKGNANIYRMKLTFQNEGENSLLQLLHMAQQVSALRKVENVQPI